MGVSPVPFIPQASSVVGRRGYDMDADAFVVALTGAIGRGLRGELVVEGREAIIRPSIARQTTFRIASLASGLIFGLPFCRCNHVPGICAARCLCAIGSGKACACPSVRERGKSVASVYQLSANDAQQIRKDKRKAQGDRVSTLDSQRSA